MRRVCWSLNEIEALARKAARGAGYDWGMAEEAGRAVRWLATRALPGPDALCTALQQPGTLRMGSGATPGTRAMLPDPGQGQCPLALGVMLSDGVTQIGPKPVLFKQVVSPLLLLPFACWAAETGTPPLGRLRWGSTEIAISAVHGAGHDTPIENPKQADVWLTAGSQPAVHWLTAGSRAMAAPDTVAVLSGFAARTYAPATEQSRLSGAGAGLLDND